MAVPSESDLLVMELCGEWCALPLEAVQEIVPIAELARLPGLPPLVEGFLNLHGEAVPVLRLGRLFRREQTPPGLYTPLVVMRGEPHALALLVDGVVEVASVPGGGFMPVGEGESFNGCATAEVTIHGRAVHLLSAERLLLEKERRCVAELQARAQQYLDELEAT